MHAEPGVHRPGRWEQAPRAGSVKPARTCPLPSHIRQRGHKLLNQQFWLWGQDVRHAPNLLALRGFIHHRLPPDQAGSPVYILGEGEIALWGFGLLAQFADQEPIYVNRFCCEPRLPQARVAPQDVWLPEQLGPLQVPASPEAWCSSLGRWRTCCAGSSATSSGSRLRPNRAIGLHAWPAGHARSARPRRSSRPGNNWQPPASTWLFPPDLPDPRALPDKSWTAHLGSAWWPHQTTAAGSNSDGPAGARPNPRVSSGAERSRSTAVFKRDRPVDTRPIARDVSSLSRDLIVTQSTRSLHVDRDDTRWRSSSTESQCAVGRPGRGLSAPLETR